MEKNPSRRRVAAKSNSRSVVSEGTLMESEAMLSQILSQRTESLLLETIQGDMRGVCEDSLDNSVTYFLDESQEMSQYLAVVVVSPEDCAVSSGDSVVPMASSGPEPVEILTDRVKTGSGGDCEKADTSGCSGQEVCNVEVSAEAGAGISKLVESESPVKDFGAVVEPEAATSKSTNLLALELESPVEDFGVVVELVDTKFSKNFVFSERLDKIYCAPRHKIPFQFTLDAVLRKGQVVKMVAFLRFTDPEVIVNPVRRCDVHANRDVMELRKNPGISEEDVALTQHVLRSDHPKAVHLVEAESKRFKVSIPLDPTEVKTGKFSRNFKFGCLNSCHGHIKQRRLLEVVFEIYSSNTLVGKATKNVRVCSLPIRDLHVDISHITKTEASAPVSETIRDVSTQSEKKPKARSRSKRKRNVSSRSRSERKRNVSSKSESKPKISSQSRRKRKAGAQSEKKSKVKTEVKKPRVEQNQAGPSRSDPHRSPSASTAKSEESDASESGEALKQAKWILDHCVNENHLVRSLANGCLRQIQHTHRMMKLALHHQDCPKNAKSHKPKEH